MHIFLKTKNDDVKLVEDKKEKRLKYLISVPEIILTIFLKT